MTSVHVDQERSINNAVDVVHKSAITENGVEILVELEQLKLSVVKYSDYLIEIRDSL